MTNTKKKLLEKISSIQDQDTIDYLSDMLSHVNDMGVFELSKEMKEDLDKSISQIENGEYETHEKVMSKHLNGN